MLLHLLEKLIVENTQLVVHMCSIIVCALLTLLVKLVPQALCSGKRV